MRSRIMIVFAALVSFFLVVVCAQQPFAIDVTAIPLMGLQGQPCVGQIKTTGGVGPITFTSMPNLQVLTSLSIAVNATGAVVGFVSSFCHCSIVCLIRYVHSSIFVEELDP